MTALRVGVIGAGRIGKVHTETLALRIPEVTVAAVISDPAHERKLVIADTRIVPQMAALDPLLMAGLPPAVTAATGMDALTHAVEAYLGEWSTEFTDRMALSSVAMIFENLPRAYDRGDDLVAREQMALASTYAGMAFTRANVGNVHAIAHQLGGKYHTPHGLANAIMLPHVLRFLSLHAGVGHARSRDLWFAGRSVHIRCGKVNAKVLNISAVLYHTRNVTLSPR